MDLATLNLQVNSAGVAQATLRLNDLVRAGGRAEAASNRLRTSFSLHDAATGRLGLTYSKLIQLTGAAAAGIGLVGAAVKAVTDAAKFESLEAGLESLMGSAQAAKQLITDLREYAGKTPVNFEKMVEQAKFMKAMGFDTGEIVTNVKTVSNAVAALGGGVNSFERIVLALGQMRQKGHAASQEMRQLADANINSWGLLAKTLGITVPEAQKRVQRGMVNAEVAIKAILDGMDQQFANAAERQSKTLLGAWTILKNNITFVMKDVGDELVRSLDLTGAVQTVTRWIKVAAAVFLDVVRVLRGGNPEFKAAGDLVRKIADAVRLVVDLLKIWIAIKIVTTLEGMARNAILFAMSMKDASIASRPLLTTVLAVGVALGSWALGKTLLEQFEGVRRAALNVIGTIAKAKAILGDDPTFTADYKLHQENIKKFGVEQGTVFTAMEQLQANHLIGPGAPRQFTSTKTYNLSRKGTLNDQEQALLDRRIADIKADRLNMTTFLIDYMTEQTLRDWNAELKGNPQQFGDAFSKNLRDTIKFAADGLTETGKGLFGDLFPTGFAAEMKTLTDAYEKLTDTRNKDADAAGRVLSEEKQLTGVKGLISELQREREEMGLLTYQRERAQAVQKATLMLDKTSIADKQKWIDLVGKEVDLNYQRKAQLEVERELTERMFLLETAPLTGDALQKEAAYRQLINKYLMEGVPLSEEFLRRTRQQSDAIEDVRLKWEQVHKAAEGVGDAFARAFEDAAFEAKGFKDVMLGLVKDVNRALVQAFVTEPLKKGVTSIASGILGSIFAGGPEPKRSADGNVFTSPGLSTFGEEGPEVIAPLFRGADGKLGVRSTGGGRTTIVNMKVYAQDAASFNKSNRQIKDGVRRAL